jgi:UDP-N-acetylmuramoylalanine--D-glutamate ligase
VPLRLAGRRVLVAGMRTSGRSVARAAVELGAEVSAVDARADERTLAAAAELAALGVDVHPGGDGPELLDRVFGAGGAGGGGPGLVVTSPGLHPDHPLLAAAAARGLEVIGDVELAWRLRGPGAAPWLAITGTNGKTTTTRMATAMALAGGLRAVAAGNVGVPLVDVVTGAAGPAELVVAELSSFQLHWCSTLRCDAGALLNLAEDHLDWHGGFARYVADKLRIWSAAAVAVGVRDDPLVAERLAAAPGRRVAVTAGPPEPGELGVVDGALVDRAFAGAGSAAGEPLVEVCRVRPAGPHHVVNALVAAALVRSRGVPAAAVREGLAALPAEPHRGEIVATVAGVGYVNDSKATNPHAAAASLAGHPRVVWIVGGLLKGADLAPAVQAAASRLAGAVVVGVDRRPVLEALARHAPEIPVTEVTRTDTGAMADAVRAAARLARPGDVVLLAPAAASFDLFRDYAERGDAFRRAATELAAAGR